MSADHTNCTGESLTVAYNEMLYRADREDLDSLRHVGGCVPYPRVGKSFYYSHLTKDVSEWRGHCQVLQQSDYAVFQFQVVRLSEKGEKIWHDCCGFIYESNSPVVWSRTDVREFNVGRGYSFLPLLARFPRHSVPQMTRSSLSSSSRASFET